MQNRSHSANRIEQSDYEGRKSVNGKIREVHESATSIFTEIRCSRRVNLSTCKYLRSCRFERGETPPIAIVGEFMKSLSISETMHAKLHGLY